MVRSRNCHGSEVFCCDFIVFCFVEHGIFLYVVQCNATVLQLNWYILQNTIPIVPDLQG